MFSESSTKLLWGFGVRNYLSLQVKWEQKEKKKEQKEELKL